MKNSIYQIVIGGLCFISILCSCENNDEKNSSPICDIVKPNDNDTIEIGDALQIQVESSDEDGTISEVRFYIDDTGVSSSSIYPYKFSWDTKSERIGNHQIKVVAIDDKGAQASEEINIFIVGLPSDAYAGSDQAFYDGRTTTTLEANKPIVNHGNGKWTVVDGDGGKFSNDTVPNTVFTGLKCTQYLLKWTISNTISSSSSNVKVYFGHLPVLAQAGADQSIIDKTSAVLSANKPETGFGSGSWSVESGIGGVFGDKTNPLSVFTGKSCESYKLLWTISTECSSYTDTVSISFPCNNP